jgi:glycosyltransferase involved in cell wall biosynthesis
VRARVVIPTFDERETIGSLIVALRRWLPSDTRLLIVDDGSPDGTGSWCATSCAPTPAWLIERTGKLGLGTAYQTAFRQVLAEGGDDLRGDDGRRLLARPGGGALADRRRGEPRSGHSARATRRAGAITNWHPDAAC